MLLHEALLLLGVRQAALVLDTAAGVAGPAGPDGLPGDGPLDDGGEVGDLGPRPQGQEHQTPEPRCVEQRLRVGQPVHVDLQLDLLHEGVEARRQRAPLEAGVQDLLQVEPQAAAGGAGPVQAAEGVAHVAEDEGAAAHRRASTWGRPSNRAPWGISIDSRIELSFDAASGVEASGALPSRWRGDLESLP